MASHAGGPSGGGVQFEADEQVDERLDEPRMYRVFIHNDHYTSMDFVVEVLVKVFRMPVARATQVMLDVHQKGVGECGVYTFDVAQTKVNQVHSMARAREYPLKSSYEEA